jgi:surfactin synthase thioesterase subunit
MAGLALKSTPWINTFPGAPPLSSAKCILLCIPHAGGTTMSYRSWQKSLPDVLIAAVALPGKSFKFRTLI